MSAASVASSSSTSTAASVIEQNIRKTFASSPATVSHVKAAEKTTGAMIASNSSSTITSEIDETETSTVKGTVLTSATTTRSASSSSVSEEKSPVRSAIAVIEANIKRSCSKSKSSGKRATGADVTGLSGSSSRVADSVEELEAESSVLSSQKEKSTNTLEKTRESITENSSNKSESSLASTAASVIEQNIRKTSASSPATVSHVKAAEETTGAMSAASVASSSSTSTAASVIEQKARESTVSVMRSSIVKAPVPKQIVSKLGAPIKSTTTSVTKKETVVSSIATAPTRKPAIPKQQSKSASLKASGTAVTPITLPIPPFISDIDLKDEMIQVRNPSSTICNLSGWHISDDEKRNSWTIPANTTIPPRGSLHIYCCAKGEHMRHLKEPNLFWTNKNGTRRMKNVLNDDGEKISLLRPDKTFVASCEKRPGEEAVVVKSNVK